MILRKSMIKNLDFNIYIFKKVQNNIQKKT